MLGHMYTLRKGQVLAYCLSSREAISSLLNLMIVSHLLYTCLVLNALCAHLRSRAIPFPIVEVKKPRPKEVE